MMLLIPSFHFERASPDIIIIIIIIMLTDQGGFYVRLCSHTSSHCARGIRDRGHMVRRLLCIPGGVP